MSTFDSTFDSTFTGAFSIVAPTVTTNSSSVVSNDVTLNGEITDDGGGAISERGFYYGTTSGSLTTKVVEGGTTTGVFAETITGLSEGTYYFEAFATNSAGEARGTELSFTIVVLASVQTQAPVVSGSDVTMNGVVTDNGSGTVTERGFYYGTTPGNLTNKVVSLDTSLDYSQVVSGLAVDTYYHEAYAINEAGEARGAEVTFSITSTPSVNTLAATTTGDSATLNGEITDDGGSSITERGFYYGTTSGSLGTRVVEGGTAAGTFSEIITSLADGTYYFEAFAANSNGEVTGSELSFTVITIPTIYTSAASSVTSSGATLNGSITDDGGSSITERGFYFGTASGNLTNKIVEGGTATGSFSEVVDNLTPNTYYFEAYATNANGEATGGEFSFTTSNALILTSDTANLFSHNVYFQIAMEDTSSASYDIDLIDMGKLQYSFDIPNSGEDVTAVGIKAGSIDVKFDNYIDGTDTIIDLLDSSFSYSSTQAWYGKMFFKLKSDASYGNPVLFEFSPKEVKFNEVSQICEISFIPRQKTGLTAVSVCDDAESEVYTYTIDRTTLIDPSANDNIAYAARDYIKHALFQGYSETPTYPISGVTIEIDSGIFISDGGVLRVSGEEWFVTYQTVISGTPTTIPYTDDALVLLGTLASLEGAIYGTALGNLFYIARSDTSNSVTLDTDNIKKLEQSFFNEAKYRQLKLAQVDYADNDINVIAFSRNTFAEKDINIRLDPPLLIKGDITTAGQANQIADDNTILLEAVNNYQPPFSFDNEKKVTVTYWGIDGIYPYSVITFDTNAPDFVKNRNFRVKKAEYDFKADTIKMEIYEI